MYFTHPQFNNLNPLFKKYSEANLRKKLAKFFPNQNIVFTDLGRSAFQLTIKHLNLENSEMLVPAYICDIFKPIFKRYNIKPIYLDINLDTFHAKIEETKITSKAKSILACHTYGLPVEMTEITKIAKKYNLKIIEDCAHLHLGNLPRLRQALRGRSGPRTGASEASRGDCAFFSFPKLCPTVNGGMLVCKKPIKANLKKHKIQLTNLIRFARLFPSLANASESFRKGFEASTSNKLSPPRKSSEQSLKIFNWYLDNFEEQNLKRKELAEYFHKKLKEKGIQSTGITYISALVPNRDKLFNKLRKKGIYCSRIWHKPLFKDLPNTSIVASRIINFPFQTWFKKKDIDKILKKLR